jgi:hypothetical protein
MVGLNAAGWWLTTLLARADASMRQIGFLAIASQLRNMASLAPGLLTESSLAVMAQGEDAVARTPDRVMAVCTWATTFASLALAGLAIAVIPWALPFLYGRGYTGATVAVAIALATAVVHMGSGPASARVSILSIRTTGLINTLWAVLVSLAAASFIWYGGSAAKAASIYFGAHVVSSILLWLTLRRRQSMPAGMTAVLATGFGTALVLVFLAHLRESHSATPGPLSGLLALVTIAGLCALLAIARRQRWLPNLSQLKRLLRDQWSSRRGVHA